MTNEILIINGPNLNNLGKRDNNLYGTKTLGELVDLCNYEAKKLNIKLSFKQSNYEGDIINWIQQAESNNFKGIVINPGAYSHTSIAIMDAILDCSIPVIEVHISNIYAREPFRNFSYTSKACKGVISGLGFWGYVLALYAIDKN